MTYYCDYCDIHFYSWHALQQHWIQSPRHDYCQPCDKHFDDEEELKEHYDEHHIWCRECHRFFEGYYGLREHYRQSQVHYYCPSCDRHFQSENNLRAVSVHCLLTVSHMLILFLASELLSAQAQGFQMSSSRMRSCLHLRIGSHSFFIFINSRLYPIRDTAMVGCHSTES